LIWSKARSISYTGSIYDKVRGAGASKHLTTSETEAEGTGNWVYGHISAFNSDGYSIGAGTDGSQPYANENESGHTYVSWNWKANGSGVSNTSGSITSTVSANADAGFSIVSYTGNATAGATIGHGLSSAPEMVIVKNRDSSVENWPCFHTDLGATKGIYLNQTAAPYTLSIYWNDTTPTNSLITLGGWEGVNESGSGLIAYCFHSVDGYSKVGSYTGNGSSDGTFVYCGFRPAYLMIKVTNLSGESWVIKNNKTSPHNIAENFVYANLAEAEQGVGSSSRYLDLLSNGFKWRGSSVEVNGSGYTYIFIAFAESPFKNTNAR